MIKTIINIKELNGTGVSIGAPKEGIYSLTLKGVQGGITAKLLPFKGGDQLAILEGVDYKLEFFQALLKKVAVKKDELQVSIGRLDNEMGYSAHALKVGFRMILKGLNDNSISIGDLT